MDDIDRLLDETAQRYPDKAQLIYGHSLGGNLVLNYALRRKPRLAGVVSTSPAIRVTKPLPATQFSHGKSHEQAETHHADAERPIAR